MDDATRKTLPFAAWWAAYTVIGGATFVLSNLLLRLSAVEDMTAVFLSVLLTVGLGWLGASWVQRMVARRVAASAPQRTEQGR